ncbi:hypothetical protein [Colwellia sp. UCD-KL20]|uniref:hypothetical protein n=1 Tax=Colwellia sp. UCD-KL20 TaxID=1917165 RepID=UPI0009702737|nr:hypothetical protein [Colwellia sp. UCD-KL20]
MDIFTTQLRRVVQTPIKPANSKVKGPAKEPATAELTEDFDHLEQHAQYVECDLEKEQAKQNQADKRKPEKNNVEEETSDSVDSKQDEDKPSHLDIYV